MLAIGKDKMINFLSLLHWLNKIILKINKYYIALVSKSVKNKLIDKI
jgi:hypothetical protein